MREKLTLWLTGAALSGGAGAILGLASARAILTNDLIVMFAAGAGVVAGIVLHPLYLWATWGRPLFATWIAVLGPTLVVALATSSHEQPVESALVTVAAFVIHCLLGRMLIPRTALPGQCTRCGYVLATDGERCPECGQVSPASRVRRWRAWQVLPFGVLPCAAIVIALVVAPPAAKDASAEELYRMLNGTDMTTQHNAVMELASRRIDQIRPLLSDGDAGIRRNAVRALRFSNVHNKCALLLSALEDATPEVRYEASLGIKECTTIADLPLLRQAHSRSTNEDARDILENLMDDLDRE